MRTANASRNGERFVDREDTVGVENQVTACTAQTQAAQWAAQIQGN
jgi:hypothetical protein